MRELITIIKEHKIILVIFCILIVLLLAWSVFQYVTGDRVSNVEVNDTNINESTTTVSETVKNAHANLSDSQRRHINEYTEKEKEIIAFLKNNTWITENQTASLIFTDTTFTETAGSDMQSHPFAITAHAEDIIVGDGTSYEGEMFTVETDTETFIIKRWRWVTGEDSASEWKLKSDGFKKNAEYIRSSVSTNFEIIGPNEEVYALFGGEEKLNTAMREFITQSYPTATKATWREDVEIDYRNKRVATSFVINNKTSSVITAIYNKESGETTIE